MRARPRRPAAGRIVVALVAGLAFAACGGGKEPERALDVDTTLAHALALANTAEDDGLSEDQMPEGLVPFTLTDEREPAAAAAEPPAARIPPAASLPRAAARPPAMVPASGERAESVRGPASCDTPGLDEQRACLVGMLAVHDVTLNRNYRSLIERLRRDAGTGSGEADPPSVQALRARQRGWLVFRDRECRRRLAGREGALWARARAECLAEFSAQRARELTAM